MNPELAIIFNTVAVLALIAQALNYWLLSRGIISRHLFLFVLSCYIVTETTIAVVFPALWGQWAYVALSCWGAYQFLRNDVNRLLELVRSYIHKIWRHP